MQYIDVVSSNVDSIAYDDNGKVLGVRFRNGGEYHYLDVPRHVFDGFFSAPSVGSYLDQRVKKAGFSYRRLR